MAAKTQMSPKARAVKAYEKNCPQKLKDYVVNTLGHKCCSDWDFEKLADEFGWGYEIYWNEKLKQMTELLMKADLSREFGKQAFESGKPRVPALDQAFLNTVMPGLQVGEGNEFLTAWLQGWDKANLAE